MSRSLTESGIPSFNDPVRDMTHLLYGSRMRLSTPRTTAAESAAIWLRLNRNRLVILRVRDGRGVLPAFDHVLNRQRIGAYV